jgi:hypothetical protein
MIFFESNLGKWWWFHVVTDIYAVAIDRIDVGRFLELDASIARMGVQFGQVVEHGGRIGGDGHWIGIIGIIILFAFCTDFFILVWTINFTEKTNVYIPPFIQTRIPLFSSHFA